MSFDCAIFVCRQWIPFLKHSLPDFASFFCLIYSLEDLFYTKPDTHFDLCTSIVSDTIAHTYSILLSFSRAYVVCGCVCECFCLHIRFFPALRDSTQSYQDVRVQTSFLNTPDNVFH